VRSRDESSVPSRRFAANFSIRPGFQRPPLGRYLLRWTGIRFVKPDVYTIGMGLVASAGAIILLASPKDKRIGLPNSHYLIHQPLSGIRGVATEIEIHAKELEKLRKKINKLIAEETGVKEDQVEKDTDRDYWMNAEEASDYGLISKIVTSRKDLD